MVAPGGQPPSGISKTSIYVAAGRALSLRYDDAMKDVEVVTIVRMMTVRTRFIDEALTRAIAGGATQVVILGAGLDSHAYRCQELLAHVRVFEVDRPMMQALKRLRVRISRLSLRGTGTIRGGARSSSWKA